MDRKAQPETHGISPVQRLVLASAGGRRDHAKLVFMLDNECAHIARQTHEPMMAQIRLAWWRDGLRAENLLPQHRSELMESLRGSALFGQSRDALIAIIDGWEELIVADGEDWATMLPRYAEGRGQGLFAALWPQGQDDIADTGRVWALWDLTGNIGDEALAATTASTAQSLVQSVGTSQLSRLPRMLRLLAIPAITDALNGRGAPRRLTAALYLRLLRIQLLGR